MSTLIKVFILFFALAILGLTLITGACIGYNSRINKIEIALCDKLSPNSSIEFQSYVDKFDIQSNWFILYVTLLFGVFGIFGYTFIVKVVEGKAKDVDRQTNRTNKTNDEKYKGYFEQHDKKISDKLDLYKKYFMRDVALMKTDFTETKKELYIHISNMEGFLGLYFTDIHLGYSFNACVNAAKIIFKAHLLAPDEIKDDMVLSHLTSAFAKISLMDKANNNNLIRTHLKNNENDIRISLVEINLSQNLKIQAKCAEVNVSFTRFLNS